MARISFDLKEKSRTVLDSFNDETGVKLQERGISCHV